MSRVGLGYFSACQHYCLWVAGRAEPGRAGGRRRPYYSVCVCIRGEMDGWTTVTLGPAAPPILGRSTGTAARQRRGRLADEDDGDDDAGCGGRRRV